MKTKKSIVITGVSIGIAMLILGYLAQKMSLDLTYVALVVLVPGLWLMYRYFITSLGQLRRERKEAVKILLERQENESKHLEALISLNAALQPKYPLPMMRGYTISPDFANLIMQTIGRYQPKVIVECGSGVSTLISSYAVSRYKGGHIYALEHLPEYARSTRELLHLHQMTEYATVCFAEIVKLQVDGSERSWYNPEVLNTIQDIDLLIVDGPPGNLANMARYPALPLLEQKLKQDAIILLDDYGREDEKSIVKIWSGKYNFSEVTVFTTGHGSCMLKRPPLDI